MTGLKDSMTGPQLMFLKDKRDIFTQDSTHFFLPVADNVNLLFGTGLVKRVPHPADQGLAGSLMDNFGVSGFHALALAGSHYHSTDIHEQNLPEGGLLPHQSSFAAGTIQSDYTKAP